MSHVKLIAETCVYICHKNMKSVGLFFFFFLQFFESFRGKMCKLYIEHYRKNYQADTDALNKNVVQYIGDCE